jgi:acylphosphatase
MPGSALPARLDATVRGRVQGVGFRYFVLREAWGLGVNGWVANERDGSVRCVAEGDRATLEELLEALRRGPRGARIEGMSVAWSEPLGNLDGFVVRSGSHEGD